MTNKKQSKMDGFYIAYFTGVAGNSFAMFVFKEQVIAGADAGGGTYDGDFDVTPDGAHIEGKVRFALPVGQASITGAATSAEPLKIEVPLRLPTDFNATDVHRIETPIGPINARFEKVRGF
jgi:hypothetical protein